MSNSGLGGSDNRLHGRQKRTLVGRGLAHEVVSARLKLPCASPRTMCVRLPPLRWSAQGTDGCKDRLPLIIPGWGSRGYSIKG